MSLRNAWLGLLAISIVTLAGCRKPAPPEEADSQHHERLPQTEVIAEMRWSGKHNIERDTNCSGLMSIWSLPESKNLETQVLSNLATVFLNNSVDSPVSSNLQNQILLPMLKDILEGEVLCEVRSSTNGAMALNLAFGLAGGRIPFWQTNLPNVVGSLGFMKDGSGLSSDWARKKDNKIWLLEFQTTNGWVVVRFGAAEVSAPSNLLEILTRAEKAETASPPILSGRFHPAKRDHAFADKRGPLSKITEANFTLSGTGPGVRIAGDVEFNSAIPVRFESWNVPTNLISDPLISFTAVRGIAGWVESLDVWQQLEAGSPPNQVFLWAQAGMPFLSYLAAPATNGGLILKSLSDRVLPRLNGYMTNHGIGLFTYASNRIEWAEAPLINPFLMAVEEHPALLLGGLTPSVNTMKGVPDPLLTQLETPTNTLYYDWELTGARLEQWMNFSQLARLATGKAQLPLNSTSFAWLKALEGRLENSGTRIQTTHSNRVSFVRNSTVGLTAPELILLGDWLESPTFPTNLNSLISEPDVVYPRKSKHTSRTPSTSSAVR